MFFLPLAPLLFLCAIAQCSFIIDVNKDTIQNSGSYADVSIPAEVNSSVPLPWLSPEYRWFFEYALPIPPIKRPKLSVGYIQCELSKLIAA